MVELRWTELMEGAVAARISANKAVLCLSLIRDTVLLRSLSLAGHGGEGERGCRSGAGGLEAGPGSSLVLALWCGARWSSPALAAVLPWWMTVDLALEVRGQLNKHLLCCRCRRGGLAFPCLFLAGLGGEGAEVGEGVAACVRVRRCCRCVVKLLPAGRGGEEKRHHNGHVPARWALFRCLRPAEGARGGVDMVVAVGGLLSSGLWCSFILFLRPAVVARGEETVLALPLFSGGQDVGAAEVVEWSVVEGSGRSGLDRMRFELGVCRRPMFVKFSLDPVRRNWWMLRLVKAFWRGVLPSPGFGVDGGFFAGVRAGGGPGRWREVEDDDGLLLFLMLYPFVLLYSYAYVCCILTTVY